MSSTPIVLIGGGGHASDVLQAIEACNSVQPTYEVLGIVADREIDHRRFRSRNVRYLGGLDRLAELDAQYVLCLGWPWTRSEVARCIDEFQQPADPIIHPAADVGVGSEIGAGSVVLGHAHLSPFVRLGRHALVSYTASVGHDSVLGDFVSVMPGANVSGDVFVGDEVLIGTGASVLETIRVGDRARIGAGAVVVGDLGTDVTVTGVPARPQ